jgi:heavy metal efflux system protein
LGVGINTMTLGGLAIAVGLLVDAAIIMAENIVHRMTVHRGEGTRREQALHATVEVGRPIAFATLIVIAVFLLLFAMSGMEGRIYMPLAAAVISAIAASLILALTLVPVGSALLLRPRPEGKPADVWIIRRLKQIYAPVLDACMRRPKTVVLISVLVTAPTIAAGFYIGSDFMPKLDEGAFMINTILPPEASLDQVDRINHNVEDALRGVPEVDDVVRRTGRAERTEDPMVHTQSDILVVLKPGRRLSTEELEQVMREKVTSVPGASALITTPLLMRIDESLGGTPADLYVRVFGPDLDQLAQIGERARTIMAQVKGVTDLRVEKLTGMPQLKIAVNRAAVARVGLTPEKSFKRFALGSPAKMCPKYGWAREDLISWCVCRTNRETIRTLFAACSSTATTERASR